MWVCGWMGVCVCMCVCVDEWVCVCVCVCVCIHVCYLSTVAPPNNGHIIVLSKTLNFDPCVELGIILRLLYLAS